MASKGLLNGGLLAGALILPFLCYLAAQAGSEPLTWLLLGLNAALMAALIWLG